MLQGELAWGEFQARQIQHAKVIDEHAIHCVFGGTTPMAECGMYVRYETEGQEYFPKMLTKLPKILTTLSLHLTCP